jgi:group I intron endonuclease
MSDVHKKIENPGRFKTGYKPSDETRTKISDALKGENNPMYGKNHTEETKTIMSEAKKGQQKPSGSGSPSQAIEVTDNNTNEKTLYDSMSAAARALNINICRISNYFVRNQVKPYKGQYTFKKI